MNHTILSPARKLFEGMSFWGSECLRVYWQGSEEEIKKKFFFSPG